MQLRTDLNLLVDLSADQALEQARLARCVATIASASYSYTA